jgi:hypothetical protein
MSFSDFMKQRAVDLQTIGRYSLASRRDMQGNRREFACRTSRISPFQMMIAAPVLGPPGERLISIFGDLGKLEGWITDSGKEGLLVEIAATKDVREKLASKLAWLERAQRNAVMDARQQPRLIPENPITNLILADGSTTDCLVIDVSTSGVAVSADVEPEIGTRLAVGRAVGHVVRRFGEGFAVQFDRVYDRQRLEQIIRPPDDLLAYLARLADMSPPVVSAMNQQNAWLVD